MDGKRLVNLFLIILSATTLVLGGTAHILGWPELARSLWLAGSSIVLIAVCVDIVAALLRREAGLDLIALVSIGGAIALDEFLTGAVIALMFASGRALETFAEERARREMSALLANVPRSANRYDNNVITQVPLEKSDREIACLCASVKSFRLMGDYCPRLLCLMSQP